MKTEFLEQPSYTAVPYNQQVTVYKIVAYKLFLSHSLLIVNKQDSYYKKTTTIFVAQSNNANIDYSMNQLRFCSQLNSKHLLYNLGNIISI